MISSTAFLTLIIIGSLILLVVFTLAMRKVFKMKLGTAILVNLILVPVLLGGLIMGVAQPFKVTIVGNGTWMPYWVFGADQLDYTLDNGDSLHIMPPEAGLCLVNNSHDTLVIEKVYYGKGTVDNLSYLLMIEPMSGASFAGLELDFSFADQPPLSISTSKSATKVKRYWLRHLSDDDFDNFVLFHGETFRGKPHGQGKLFDPDSGEILEGIWNKGTFLGLGEVGDGKEPKVN
jgi:hypothetical protein